MHVRPTNYVQFNHNVSKYSTVLRRTSSFPERKNYRTTEEVTTKIRQLRVKRVTTTVTPYGLTTKDRTGSNERKRVEGWMEEEVD